MLLEVEAQAYLKKAETALQEAKRYGGIEAMEYQLLESALFEAFDPHRIRTVYGSYADRIRTVYGSVLTLTSRPYSRLWTAPKAPNRS